MQVVGDIFSALSPNALDLLDIDVQEHELVGFRGVLRTPAATKVAVAEPPLSSATR